MAYVNTYNAGVETASVTVSADGLGVAANANRVFILVQNRGTASAGISFQSSAPAAQINCSILLAPASVDGGADGDVMVINWSKEAMGCKFAAAGTKNLVATEVV